MSNMGEEQSDSNTNQQSVEQSFTSTVAPAEKFSVLPEPVVASALSGSVVLPAPVVTPVANPDSVVPVAESVPVAVLHSETSAEFPIDEVLEYESILSLLIDEIKKDIFETDL